MARVALNRQLDETARREGAQAALELFKKDDKPDVVALGTVIRALGKEGKVDAMLKLLAAAPTEPNVPVYNTALHHLGKVGDVSEKSCATLVP